MIATRTDWTPKADETDPANFVARPWATHSDEGFFQDLDGEGALYAAVGTVAQTAGQYRVGGLLVQPFAGIEDLRGKTIKVVGVAGPGYATIIDVSAYELV